MGVKASGRGTLRYGGGQEPMGDIYAIEIVFRLPTLITLLESHSFHCAKELIHRHYGKEKICGHLSPRPPRLAYSPAFLRKGRPQRHTLRACTLLKR